MVNLTLAVSDNSVAVRDLSIAVCDLTVAVSDLTIAVCDLTVDLSVAARNIPITKYNKIKQFYIFTNFIR